MPPPHRTPVYFLPSQPTSPRAGKSGVGKLLPAAPARPAELPADASTVPCKGVLWPLIELMETFTLAQRRMSRKSRCLFFWTLSSSFSRESNSFLSLITVSAQKNGQLDAVSCPSRDLMHLSTWSAPWTLPKVWRCGQGMLQPLAELPQMQVVERLIWETGLGRNTCVGMGHLAGVMEPTAFAGQAIEDILVRQSMQSIADEVGQLKNRSDIMA